MANGAISSWIPSNPAILLVLIIALSSSDSVLVGYDSSLMGSINVLPSYNDYFALTTATKAFNTCVSYVGGCTASLFSGFIVDWRGRKEAIALSALLALIGGIIQGAAINIGMFIAGRFIVGFGLAFGQTAAPTLVAELCPVNKRGFALGLYYACWGVGTLIASGVCYGTQSIPNNWSWRIPSLLQAAPSFVVFGILFFLPESPRWLISRDRHHEALQVLQITQGDHKNENPESSQVVAVQYREIADTIAWEKEQGLSLFQAMTRKSSRRRLGIAATFSLFVMLPGTNLITFYFGDLLASAGITDPTTQLEVNVILTSWTLVVAVLGSLCADKFPRKWLCAGSLIGGVITLYMFAGLTAVYGQSNNTSGIYATVAMIFLYNATYGFGITPLTVLYPPEILSFDIRAVGMGLYTFTTKLSGLFVTMVLPFGLAAISWKVYIINASVDILFVVYVVIFWVETRGLTLEEVDRIFDGEKHSDVADLQEVKQGVVEVDPLAVIEGKDVGISTEVRETGEKDV